MAAGCVALAGARLGALGAAAFPARVIQRGHDTVQLVHPTLYREGLRREHDALRAALMLPWSTGPVEGQITL